MPPWSVSRVPLGWRQAPSGAETSDAMSNNGGGEKKAAQGDEEPTRRRRCDADPDYADFTLSLHSSPPRSSTTLHPQDADGTGIQSQLVERLNEMLLDPIRERYHQVAAQVTAERATELVREHMVNPMNQAYQDMSAKATELVQTHVVDPVTQAYEAAPEYFQTTVVDPIKDAYSRAAATAAEMYDENVVQPAAKAAGSFTDFLKSHGLWHDDDEAEGGGEKNREPKAGDAKPAEPDNVLLRKLNSTPFTMNNTEPKNELPKVGSDTPLKPALKKRDSLTLLRPVDSVHKGAGAAKSPDVVVEETHLAEPGGKDHKVKFGAESVRVLPPEKKRNRHDFNEVMEDHLGKISTRPTSQKESKELLESMLKEAEKSKVEDSKKPEKEVPLDAMKTAGKRVGGKTACAWVATPTERHDYQKFQEMLKGSGGDKDGEAGGFKDRGAPKHDKPGDRHDDKHEDKTEGTPGLGHEHGAKDSGKPRRDKKPEKTDAKTGETPRDKPPNKPGAKPDIKPAEDARGPSPAAAGPGEVNDVPKKSRSWWQKLLRFFRRKPADEESSEEARRHYPEMDEEFIECGDDFAAGDEVVGAGKRSSRVAAAAPPRQYKLNACALVTSGFIIFVVLLAILLSGDLFDDLDNSVPTFNIDTGAVINVLDDAGFLGAGMNSSIMGKPGSWRPLLERPANDSLVLLLRGLAPAVLRFAGHETDHFYFVEGVSDEGSSPAQEGYPNSTLAMDGGGLALRGPPALSNAAGFASPASAAASASR